MMRADRFQHFLAVDWSGATGERHKGIAIALSNSSGGPPALIARNTAWSRADVLDHLLHDLPDNTLVGLDLGIALPHHDCGAYLPEWDGSPANARELWALVDNICGADEHFSVSSFVNHPELARYFRRQGGREGDRFHRTNARDKRGRFRITEQVQQTMGCKPYSNFNLVGAAQVGKSSLTGMRILSRIAGRIPVWPIAPVPTRGSVIAEIYTGLAAIEAGRSARRSKIRSISELNSALEQLDSPPIQAPTGPIDDHSADALMTAAWMRKIAHQPARWSPKLMTSKIAATEGWTFGAF